MAKVFKKKLYKTNNNKMKYYENYIIYAQWRQKN